MRSRFFAATLLTLVACGFFSLVAADAKKALAKFEIQLLWGTDLAKSPDAKHQPVEPDVDKKLKSLPLRFKNYFLVNKKSLTLAVGETKKEQLSEKCEVEMKNIDALKFDVAFFGKGKATAKRTQEFPVGELLIHGGNAPGSNAWLVVLKRVQ